MGRGDSGNDDETETETVDDDITESDESISEKASRLFGTMLYKLSYKRLPKKCIKYSFLTLNGISLLAGVTAIIISIWMLVDSKLMSQLLGQRLFVTILFFIGVFGSTIAVIGISGFVRRRRRFIVIYIGCHTLLLCTIFACAIMSFMIFDKIMRKIRDDMIGTIHNYRLLDWVTEAWDNTQKYLRCCGVKSYKDWSDYHMRIPQSCCSASLDQCLQMSEEVAYKTGCWMSATLLLRSHVQTVALSALLVSVATLVSLFFAFAVRKRFKGYRVRVNDRA